MTEMQNALSIGKEVTVHQSPINQSGWTGTGYIITDPATGAGAYKISGGANGGFLEWWGDDHGTYVGIALAFASLLPFAAAAPVLPVLVLTLGILSIFVSAMNIMAIDLQTSGSGCPQGLSSMGIGLEYFSLGLSFFGAGGVALGAWISFLSGGAISGITSTTVCKHI
jgi:hypothetical protein